MQSLFEAYNIEERKSYGVEDEPSVVVMDDVLAEHSYCQNCEGTTDKVAAVSHPKGIDAKHEVANSPASNCSRHTYNPSSEDVELFGRGQPDTRDCKGKSAYELDDDERYRQPQSVAHIL